VGSGGGVGTGGNLGTGGGVGTGGNLGTGGGVGTGGKLGTGGGGSTVLGCPGEGGPTMVRLPQGYCIDTTEVTRAQYAAWLAKSPSTNTQDGWCSWNTTFDPGSSCMSQRYVCSAGSGTCDQVPQICVDWCDAYAYCKAVNKRLCGKIAGGANGFDDYANASASQWYNACVSGEAANIYTYGNTYDATACMGSESAPAQSVGSHPQCQSPISAYRGIYDLTGNVWEWEDSCSGNTGPTDPCRRRGGSFGGGIAAGAGNQRCDESSTLTRDNSQVNLGFRCCAD
jgi:formylglycine-generating enzyme required for sulfatase activity